MFFKKKDKKKVFWDWFQKNKEQVAQFIQDQQNMRIYEELTKQLKKYNQILFPELMLDGKGGYVLIITPDGIKDGLQATIDLVDVAPDINDWSFVKFRQAMDHVQLQFNGLQYAYEDIKIWRDFNEEEDKVDIAVLIKGFDENDQRFLSLAFLYLDHILGEFNVISRVGGIDFLSWEHLNDEYEAIDLLQLRKEIEDKLY